MVEWYAMNGPNSLFKLGKKDQKCDICTHEPKMNFVGLTENVCHSNQTQPFEEVFYGIDANISCSLMHLSMLNPRAWGRERTWGI